MVGFPRLSNLSARPDHQAARTRPDHRCFRERRLVGTADAVTSGLTLPGGAIVDHAAVTHIGVLPSFTRRGIATELMRHQLRDISARGEVVASCEPRRPIYERYGYGVASSSQTVEVHTARATLRPGVGAGGSVRLLDVAEAWDVFAPHLCRQSPVPSGHDRSAGGVVAGCPDARRILLGLGYVAIHGEPGAELGFARYRRSTPNHGSSATSAPSRSRISLLPPRGPISDCCVSCSGSI